MPMNLEIKVEENRNTLSQEETKIVQALAILQKVCNDYSDVCGGGCPLWSMSQGECVFDICSSPRDIDIKPQKLFFAVE